MQKLGSLTLRDLHDTTTEMQKALGVREVCRNESEEAAVRVTPCDIHKKLFRSDGTPQRREVISQLAPPVVVQDFDCVAAAIAGCSFLLQGGPGTGKSTRAKEVVEAVSEKKQVYNISFTNCAVANMKT